jgi:hypothetical protein
MTRVIANKLPNTTPIMAVVLGPPCDEDVELADAAGASVLVAGRRDGVVGGDGFDAGRAAIWIRVVLFEDLVLLVVDVVGISVVVGAAPVTVVRGYVVDISKTVDCGAANVG